MNKIVGVVIQKTWHAMNASENRRNITSHPNPNNPSPATQYIQSFYEIHVYINVNDYMHACVRYLKELGHT